MSFPHHFSLATPYIHPCRWRIFHLSKYFWRICSFCYGNFSHPWAAHRPPCFWNILRSSIWDHNPIWIPPLHSILLVWWYWLTWPWDITLIRGMEHPQKLCSGIFLLKEFRKICCDDLLLDRMLKIITGEKSNRSCSLLSLILLRAACISLLGNLGCFLDWSVFGRGLGRVLHRAWLTYSHQSACCLVLLLE